jgi:uncharacterized protein YecE (DUF72 family)
VSVSDDPNKTESKYFVGPSGWSYADWFGVMYPAKRSARFDALAFVADYFNAVEVNTSFYRPVPAKMSASWVRRVAHRPSFHFTFKLHRSFTHERQGYGREAVATVLDGLQPVIEASRLGCMLLQFPWSFRRCTDSIDWLKRLACDFGAIRLAVELRHGSWAVPDTLEELGRFGMALCNIDQPKLRQCLGPASHVTATLGYVRFHGRRSDTWFAENVESHERYNYLYSMDELGEWLPRIKEMGAQAEAVYVFSNNHYRGQGPANALQLRSMLEQRPVEVPELLARTYPELEAVRAPSKGEMFPDALF